ncbi:MAG: T9SS type A sorting domain-containing protein [Chitinophagales bacterium]|nr:T9SS type A sorting domain-containing protein [Chitinophagales bacterium]
MRKYLLTLAACVLLSISISAQITVDQNDFASANETVYLSNGQINPFLNFAATGANHTWNFSTLRSTGQQQVNYLDVSSTNGVYAFFYADVFFNPNRANIALAGSDIPFNQVLGITNPYTFYYKNGNMYKKIGYGGELAGLPAPLTLTTPDTIYRFPMNFGNTSSSFSDYAITLPGVATSAYSQTRNTTIDGWGTLTTPYGTFDVLRSKSEIFGSDSVYLDSLNFGANIPRSKVTEYKWIAKNEEVPVLQINTTSVFGTEVINLILFKDNKLSITVNSVNGTLCPGSQVTVDYTTTGTFNPAAFLQTANRFTAQLSNSSGSFANPVNIGNVTATTSGTITCTIPNNTAGGTGYFIRITSNSPAYTSAVYGPLTIHPTPTASITANGAVPICVYDSLELVANSGSGFQYQWKFNTADIGGATAQYYFASAAGNYTVAVSNICGSVTSQPFALSVAQEAVHAVIPSDSATCDGSPITVVASNTSGVVPVTYQWNEKGNAIQGATDSTLLITVSGDYALVVTDSFGCTFTSTVLTLVIDSMQTPLVYINGSTFFCPGETVTLYTDTSAEYFYQWQKNGADIPGATLSSFTTVQGGDYAVIVSDTCDSAISQVTEITVTARPVHWVTPSSPASCDGSPVTITADNVSGASPVNYQWYENGDSLLGATDTFIIITAGGNYSLDVTDRFGCLYNSGDITIVFGTLPAPVVTSSGSTSFCFGESVKFTTDTNSNYTYQWLLDSMNISGANSNIYIATEGGNYAVEVSIGGGCNATSVIEKVNVYPQPQVPVITQQADSLFSTSAVGYQWYLNGAFLPGANAQAYRPGVDGSYIVEITDASGCTNASAPFDVLGTGVEETAANDWSLGIFPNPVLGTEFTVVSSEQFYEVQIFNTTGVLIFTSQLITPTNSEVMRESVSLPGVYFVKVTTKKGERVLKLIKM